MSATNGGHFVVMQALIEAGAAINLLLIRLPHLRANIRMQFSRLVHASISDELTSIYDILLALRPRLSGVGFRVTYLVASFLRRPIRHRLRELKATLDALGTPPSNT